MLGGVVHRRDGGPGMSSSIPSLGISFIWLFLGCILYDKLLLVNEACSWVVRHSS